MNPPAKSKSPFSIVYKDINFQATIGEGNFGCVWKAEWNNQVVAVKQLFHLNDPDMFKYFAREMSVLSKLDHKGCVKLLGLCKDAKGIFIITEFIPGGDLRSKLKNIELYPLSWSLRIRMAIEIAEALEYLKSKDVVHRDLKSHNLLVGENWQIKVCDFGFARVVAPQEYMTICGTDEWMAPEVALGDHYDYRADIWSFGMILIEFITRRKPPMRQTSRAYAYDERPIRERAPPDTPPEVFLIVKRCAEFYPENRAEYAEILKDLRALYARLLEEEKNLPDIPVIPDVIQTPPTTSSTTSPTEEKTEEKTEENNSTDDEAVSHHVKFPSKLDKSKREIVEVSAIKDYKADSRDEISFIKGQIIRLLSKDDCGWGYGILGAQSPTGEDSETGKDIIKGWFPFTHITVDAEKYPEFHIQFEKDKNLPIEGIDKTKIKVSKFVTDDKEKRPKRRNSTGERSDSKEVISHSIDHTKLPSSTPKKKELENKKKKDMLAYFIRTRIKQKKHRKESPGDPSSAVVVVNPVYDKEDPNQTPIKKQKKKRKKSKKQLASIDFSEPSIDKLIVYLLDNVKVGTAKARLKTYDNVFAGADLVACLLDKNGKEAFETISKVNIEDKHDAVAMINLLMRRGVFEGVKNEKFKDKKTEFYRFKYPRINFYGDKDFKVKDVVLNMAKIWISVPGDVKSIVTNLWKEIVGLINNFSKDLKIVKESHQFKSWSLKTAQLQRIKLNLDTKNESVVLFVNLHNLLVLHGLIMLGQFPTSMLERKVLKENVFWNLGGNLFSSSIIEDYILRSVKIFVDGDPREKFVIKSIDSLKFVLFSLWDGSKSTPELKFYKYNEPLEAQVLPIISGFFQKNIEIKVNEGEIWLPAILKKYSKELGDDPKVIFNSWIKTFLTDKVKSMLDKNDEVGAHWTFKFKPYEWEENVPSIVLGGSSIINNTPTEANENN